jgi:hypothetical protein
LLATHHREWRCSAEPSLDWEAEPEDEAAVWIAARIERRVPVGSKIVSLAFGAQGINRGETSRALEAALLAKGYPTVAVNDPALIIAAGGFT